ncbi:hypothetical protein Gogos_022081 [Gossypium gossypioides]|uniref:Uncharacterized protein n=1 Tax=Gossypium gossypioides TaxID=34282 RepID=A0A7J9CX69_GOSGO|nr:hypothetical protein [Gossypium gossypioides]
MERGFAALSLDDEEEKVLQASIESDLVIEEEELCLLGHSDFYCQVKMEFGFEVTEMGWDLIESSISTCSYNEQCVAERR